MKYTKKQIAELKLIIEKQPICPFEKRTCQKCPAYHPTRSCVGMSRALLDRVEQEKPTKPKQENLRKERDSLRRRLIAVTNWVRDCDIGSSPDLATRQEITRWQKDSK
jgi:hypothetical protein